MDEKILAYRSELQKRSENTQFWTPESEGQKSAKSFHKGIVLSR